VNSARNSRVELKTSDEVVAMMVANILLPSFTFRSEAEAEAERERERGLVKYQHYNIHHKLRHFPYRASFLFPICILRIANSNPISAGVSQITYF
jgi:hypothetical protein